jgi:dihydrofolate reductase
MRKLKLQMRISVDGYVATPDGNEDWSWYPDEKGWQLINELADSSDTLLLGRKMSENFIPHFEGFKPEDNKYDFAQKMVNIPKVIFTKSLDTAVGKNTTLVKGNLADEIHELKNQEGKDILVYGGASFVSSLIAGGHIDEFYLFVTPVLINKGLRIFDLLETHQKLNLISSTPLESGVVVLCYQLKHS